jgi:hypothetical protein
MSKEYAVMRMISAELLENMSARICQSSAMNRRCKPSLEGQAS